MNAHAVDLPFRPPTYWPQSPNREQLLSRIKGKARRDTARLILEGPGLAHMDAFLGRETLPADERRAWGMIHPMLMGGEYLPAQPRGTVEIARISLNSVTSDQIAVYARKTPRHIRYTVADEYGTRFLQPFRLRTGPISQAELIGLIDRSIHPGDEDYLLGLVFTPLKANYDGLGGPEGLEGFVKVTSAFYPGLEEYYDLAIGAWFEERSREREFEEGGERAA